MIWEDKEGGWKGQVDVIGGNMNAHSSVLNETTKLEKSKTWIYNWVLSSLAEFDSEMVTFGMEATRKKKET